MGRAKYRYYALDRWTHQLVACSEADFRYEVRKAAYRSSWDTRRRWPSALRGRRPYTGLPMGQTFSAYNINGTLTVIKESIDYDEERI